MEGFLFKLVGNELKITATDLETTIISNVNVDGKGDGEVVIPSNIILQTLKTMGDTLISIYLNGQDGLEIVSLTGNYKMSTWHPGDFPSPPEKIDSLSISVETQDLMKGISSTIFAVSSDPLRLAMTGIFLKISKDAFTLASTDAHKLVEYKLNRNFDIDSEISVIIPSNSCNNIEKIISASNEVTIYVTKSNAFFETDNTTIICRLIDAKYPAYEGVLPTESEVFATVDRKDLLNSLKRSLIYSNKTTNQVIFSYDGSNLNISTTDIDFGKEAKESIAAELIGAENFEISYNAKFMIDMLNVAEMEKVEFKMTERNRATVIDHDLPLCKTKFLIMPVTIGS
jgi:DNA polymerase-3 subunit beta